MGSSSCFDVRAWRSLGLRGFEILGMEQREVCDVSVVLGVPGVCFVDVEGGVSGFEG
jgi:hypothetical protein